MIVRQSIPFTINTSGVISDAIDMIGYDPVAIRMDTGWTAAAITLQTSDDGVTFRNVYDSTGAEVSLTTDSSRWVTFPHDVARSLGRFIKVRSGTASATVPQGVARDMRLVGHAIN